MAVRALRAEVVLVMAVVQDLEQGLEQELVVHPVLQSKPASG
ncbi:MAG: hypothetical protein ACXV8P_11370 [Methylobacter sp.]